MNARFLLVAVTLGACSVVGDSPPPTDDTDTPGLTARCGAVEMEVTSEAVIPDAPLTDAGAEAISQARSHIGIEAEFFEAYTWTTVEDAGDRLVLFGVSTRDDPIPYGSATFTRVDDGWRPEGWGQCRIEVSAEGYGNGLWTLDPDSEFDPRSTTLDILVTEQACASGQPPVGRAVLPIVVEETDHVSVTVLIEPVSGAAECPSNPAFPMRVNLKSALGDRTLFDAGMVPYLERPWPPTVSSLESGGREP